MIVIIAGLILALIVWVIYPVYERRLERLEIEFIDRSLELITIYDSVLADMEDNVLDDKIDWEGEFYDLHIKNDKREFLTEMQKGILEILKMYEKISRKKSYNTIKEIENYYYYELVEKTKEEIYQLGYEIKMEIWRNGWNK